MPAMGKPQADRDRGSRVGVERRETHPDEPIMVLSDTIGGARGQTNRREGGEESPWPGCGYAVNPLKVQHLTPSGRFSNFA